MNLDELQSVRDRERQSDSLQQLRESFYEDAGELVAELRAEREAAAARADDPFDAPEVNRLTDDIKTAEQTVEAIYERRVGKLVKMASFAAADMPADDEGLTAEERDLFEHLVASIEQNREQVFAALENTDSPTPDTGGEDTARAATSEAEGVGAADLMGGDTAPDESSPPARPDSDSEGESDRQLPPEARGETPPEPQTGESEPSPPRDAPTATGPTDAEPTARTDPDGAAPTPDRDASPESPADESRPRSDDADTAPAAPAGGVASEEASGTERRSDGGTARVDRATVRITEDIGEIFGVDERQYDLAAEDVVQLPSANAEPLVERDAAERLD